MIRSIRSRRGVFFFIILKAIFLACKTDKVVLIAMLRAAGDSVNACVFVCVFGPPTLQAKSLQ